jgi:hypothetical protein
MTPVYAAALARGRCLPRTGRFGPRLRYPVEQNSAEVDRGQAQPGEH